MVSADWDTLFDSIFQTLGAPAELDELVNAVAPLVGSVDAVEAAKKREDEGGRDAIVDTPSPEPEPDVKVWIRLQLQRLWLEIGQSDNRWLFRMSSSSCCPKN